MQFGNNGNLFFKISENISSSNIDKGDVWCDNAEFMRLVKDHCKDTGSTRLVVDYNDELGSSR